MEITVGVKSAAEARHFFSEGAAEVYCGYSGLPNNRQARENVRTLRELEGILALARGSGGRVFLAANVIQDRRDFPAALRLLSRLADRGLAGAIVRDPALLAYFKEQKFRFFFTLSTLANCFNSGTLAFFAGLGVSRVVLPMQMAPADARALVKNRFGLETEVFCQALYYGINVDSRCELPCPQDGRSKPGAFRDFTCLLPFRSKEGEYRMPMPGPLETLGAFYDYYHMGVDRAKVARWPNSPREADVFRKVKWLIGLLRSGVTREKFLELGRKADPKPAGYGNSFTLKPL